MVKDICELKNKLLKHIEHACDNGLEGLDTKELGEAVDMIKDLAEAEKCCYEAEYYKSVIGAMDDATEERYGYSRPDMRRYGMTTPEHMAQKPHVDQYLDGYTSGNNTRYGYNYPDDMRYGRAYNDYKQARRYYTQSNSPMDKDRMNKLGEEHVSDTVMTIRDIYMNADPEHKKRIKEDLAKLVGEM